jgi:DNA-binding transcriptional LysR family regulator
MDVHLRDLRCYVAVAEDLSFARASQRLQVTEPALTKQVRALEKSLQADLFETGARDLRLTEAGRTLLADSYTLLGAWEESAVRLAEAVDAQERLVRLGALTSVTRGLYPSALKIFHDTVEGGRVELRPVGWGDPTAGLIDSTTDVALLWLPVASAGVGFRKLLSEPRWVALAAGHPLADRTVIDFVELQDEYFVALPADAGVSRDFWLAARERAGRRVLITGEASTADEAFEMVSSGRGVVLLPAGNAELYAHPDIVCRPVHGLAPAVLAVAWRRVDKRPSVRAFVNATIEAAAAPPQI